MLSFSAGVYNKYEKELWEWKNKVVLVYGEVDWGTRKIFVNKAWEMENLQKNCKELIKKDRDLRLAFINPLSRYDAKKINDIKNLDSVFNLGDKLKKGQMIKLFGVMVGKSIFTIRNKTSKYFGGKIYSYRIFDGFHVYSIKLFPWYDHYRKTIKLCSTAIKNKTPITVAVKFDQVVGGKKSYLKLACFEFDSKSHPAKVFRDVTKKIV